MDQRVSAQQSGQTQQMMWACGSFRVTGHSQMAAQKDSLNWNSHVGKAHWAVLGVTHENGHRVLTLFCPVLLLTVNTGKKPEHKGVMSWWLCLLRVRGI